MPAHLSPAALRFLKSLKRNNDRTWFAERKHIYETELRAPWLAVVDEINHALSDVAPEYVRPANRAALRIYRDIRFSKDKRPYKNHVAAWWSTGKVVRTTGGGFYASVSGEVLTIAAGVYMPTPEQLLLIRRSLQENAAEFRKAFGASALAKLLPVVDTNPLTRMPKGFAADDPARDLLLGRQWARSIELPADLATTPKVVPDIVRRFRAALPMVQMLNAPLLAKPAPRKSLF